MADQPPITVESLARVPLLSHCSTEELSALARAAKPVSARAGAVVVREGEAADSLFVVVSGQVRVVSDAATERLLLARLGPGEFFGEMALVEGGRRSAAVVADRESALLEISREAFQQIVAADKVMADVRQTLSHRMADTQQQMLQDATVISRESGLITIGRDASNAIFINEPGVRAHHAEIAVSPAGFRIHSLGGLPDTFLNGEPIVEASLEEGDEVRIGSVRLFAHEGTIKRFQAARGIRIEAIGIGRTVAGGRQLLRDISLAISPGELVALVGPSGAGKTTLLHALLGLTRPTDGAVYYDSLRLDEHESVFRPVLGYVPQQDILHDELSVRQALWYVGRLRLPGDTSAAELNRRIDAVLEAVSLTREAQTKVSKLSGGQRKRASIAGELLSEPRVFFLDEPTSGLDPGLDAQMMRKFRELADEGRTVLVTTHATKNIELCDRVVIVVRGQLVFVGTPRQALDYFGVSDFTEIYAKLAQDDPEEQAAAFWASDTYRLNVAECLTVKEGVQGAPSPKPQRRADRPNALARTTRSVGKVARQWYYLGSRDVRVTVADRLTMAVRVFGPPLLAASLLLTFERDILAETLAQGGNARASLTLLYLAAAVSLFLGAFTASNAITRESAIFRRERMVDLSALAYVLAKATVLGAFSLFQGFIVVAVLAIGIDFPGPKAEVLLQLGLAMSVTSLAGTSLGLLVSSLSPNADRAAILVVLLIIPQLVFAGSTVPRSEMSTSALITSDAMVSKWSVELLGGIVDLDRRLDVQSYIEVAPTAGGPKIALQVPDRPFEKAFRVDLALRWLVLAGFSVMFLAGTLVVQSRKRANR